jgi:hypothetical protein|tara:strand:- start:163 stop:357 length:195 start_codon:yes stop_codon:yes gene_type:complete
VVAEVVQTYLLSVVELVVLLDLAVVELEKDLDQVELELLIQVVVAEEPNMILHLVVVELEVQEL